MKVTTAVNQFGTFVKFSNLSGAEWRAVWQILDRMVEMESALPGLADHDNGTIETVVDNDSAAAKMIDEINNLSVLQVGYWQTSKGYQVIEDTTGRVVFSSRWAWLCKLVIRACGWDVVGVGVS